MLKNKQRGQGMTEYIIIVALIAVSAIGVYSFFGQTIRNQVAGLSSEMSGVDSTAQITAAQTSAVDASNVAKEDYNLGNYNEAANKSAAGN
ncbi:pilus assembly protein [Shewanella sp. D64]|uniref:Flp family type IVb pilin n=1 Tax=unclassified Shewanella TaxID=196818 RepID=UPI0022BA1D57|nr:MULTISPECIES: pilus assembly protein [unclassified Shewanella]MEC4728095.1 pilus assembly protein [Shewanella sp. D64]MEC4738147.1 pilus assembly protein [Shewanella sp. E94]WBJ96341.1 pilus assembly protein [Shewanella sp. MTB7]